MPKKARRSRIFVTQPISAHALKRLRAAAQVKVFPDASRIIPKRALMAAVRQAETLAVLKPRKAIAGTFRRPDPKPTVGLSEPLAAVIQHREPKQGGTR